MIRARHEGHVVEWDGKFRFGGDPEGAHEVSEPAPASAVGAAFLSGRRGCPVTVLERSGRSACLVVSGPMVMSSGGDVSNLASGDSWALCGPGVADPNAVAAVCRGTAAVSMSVCPLVDPLPAFGYVVAALAVQGLARPRMTRFCEPWAESLDLDGQEFDPGLDGDGYGRMAHLVQARTPVVNQMMRTPSVPAFYGRVLSTGGWWGHPVFLMLPDAALRYFPTEPLSLRNYAATWVPVAVGNTEEFSRASGWGHSRATIFTASELTPGLGSFLRFVQMMCREDFVASSDPRDVPVRSRVPVFRHHCAYNVNAERYAEVVLEP